MTTPQVEHPRVVSPAEWLAARKELLAKEKSFSRQRDALSAERRQLPWVRLDKQYVFEGPAGRETLADLFGGKRQLIVYHFMFGPGWEQGCPSCSLVSDHLDPSVVHLAQRDVAVAVVSRATLPEIEAFRQRMGWRFKWVSSHGSDFNYDFHVSFTPEETARGGVVYNFEPRGFAGGEEAPGASIFYRDETGAVFHTYSCFARGLDLMIGAYNWLDLVPKGRDEDGLPHTMAWVRHHDRYGAGPVEA